MACYSQKRAWLKHVSTEVTTGDWGRDTGELRKPRGIAINEYSSENFYYIVDMKNNRVQVFDSNMDYSFHFGSRAGPGRMKKPIGICVSSYHNRVYITQSDYNAVYAYKLDGTYVKRVGGYGDGEAEFDQPYGLDVDEYCFVYVCDRLNNRIQVFSKKLIFQFEIEHRFLDQPIDVKVSYEDLFVLDEGDRCVKVFTTEGVYMYQMIRSGNVGRIMEPYAFDIDKKGKIYISDCEMNCIHVFDENGRYKYQIGEEGDALGEFQYPTGVAIKGRQLITVCERDENQIQVLQL